MNTQTHKKGYSLVEVMIAISILMLAIVAPMTIAFKSIQSSRYAVEQSTAIFLAQEGISIAESLRTTSFLRRIDDGIWTFWTPDSSSATDNVLDELCTSQYGCAFDASSPNDIESRNSTIVACTEDGENCRLHLNDTSQTRSPYHLRGAGDSDENKTPFIRRMYWDYTDFDGNGFYDQLIVRVEVEWDSHFLGQKQSVSLSSAFYNMYRSLSI